MATRSMPAIFIHVGQIEPEVRNVLSEGASVSHTALSVSEENCDSRVGGHDYVHHAVAVQVADIQPVARAVLVHRPRERPVTASQPQLQRGDHLELGRQDDRKIRDAVAVEIGGGQAQRESAERRRGSVRESACAVAEEHSETPETRVRDVASAVAVEVGDCAGRGRRLSRACAEEARLRTVIELDQVLADDVGSTILVEIRDAERGAAEVVGLDRIEGETGGREHRHVAQYGQRAAELVGRGDVDAPVFVGSASATARAPEPDVKSLVEKAPAADRVMTVAIDAARPDTTISGMASRSRIGDRNAAGRSRHRNLRARRPSRCPVVEHLDDAAAGRGHRNISAAVPVDISDGQDIPSVPGWVQVLSRRARRSSSRPQPSRQARRPPHRASRRC